MKLIKSNIPFTMVASEVLKDPNLSFKAKGLYAYLFSKPDEWDFAARRITIESRDGRESIMSGLQELEENRYLQRKRQSNGRVDYILTFSEKSQSREIRLRLPDPKSGNPTVAKTHSGKTRPIYKIDNTSNKENTEKEGLPETEVSGLPIVKTPDEPIAGELPVAVPKLKDSFSKDYSEMIGWLEERTGNKIMNRGKQLAALKKLRLAGYSRDKIKQEWFRLRDDKRFEEIYPDFMSVVNSLDKKRK